MTEAIKKETIEDAHETAEKRDTLSCLFEERDRPLLREEIRLPLRAPKKETEPASSSQPRKEKGEHDAAKVDDQDIVDPELKNLQAELSKTRKTIVENQKYGRQNAQRLKSALKQTQLLMESGALSQEEAQSLLASLESGDGESVPEPEVSPYDSHAFGTILKVANAELVNLRKYSDDELLDDKIKAFDYFLSVAPQEEIAESFEVLNDLIEDPVKLTKHMLNIGTRYYEEFYKDIASSGGIHQYIKSKQEEIERLNKSIDKLTKKLAQYEDYDQPRYRIQEMGELHQPSASRDPSSEIFDERDKDDLRRQKRLAINRPL